jgi:hypothetical protein
MHMRDDPNPAGQTAPGEIMAPDLAGIIEYLWFLLRWLVLPQGGTTRSSHVRVT